MRHSSPILPVSNFTTDMRTVLASIDRAPIEYWPVEGGWGYSLADACVIGLPESAINTTRGIKLEYRFVEKRIYLEMISLRPPGHQYRNINWELKEQRLITDNERKYDKLIFNITAFPETIWEELEKEYNGPEGAGHPDFNLATHTEIRRSYQEHFTSEFWFDITRFYGKQ